MRGKTLLLIAVLLTTLLLITIGCGGGEVTTEETKTRDEETGVLVDEEDSEQRSGDNGQQEQPISAEAATLGDWLPIAHEAAAGAEPESSEFLIYSATGTAGTRESTGRGDEWSYRFAMASGSSAVEIIVNKGQVTQTNRIQFGERMDIEGLREAQWDPQKTDSDAAVATALQAFDEKYSFEGDEIGPRCNVILVFDRESMERYELSKPTMLWKVALRDNEKSALETLVIDAENGQELGIDPTSIWEDEE